MNQYNVCKFERRQIGRKLAHLAEVANRWEHSQPGKVGSGVKQGCQLYFFFITLSPDHNSYSEVNSKVMIKT